MSLDQEHLIAISPQRNGVGIEQLLLLRQKGSRPRPEIDGAERRKGLARCLHRYRRGPRACDSGPAADPDDEQSEHRIRHSMFHDQPPVQKVSTAARAGHWTLVPRPRSHRHGHARRLQLRGREETDMPNIFYIIGVVVVVFAILGYLGLR